MVRRKRFPAVSLAAAAFTLAGAGLVSFGQTRPATQPTTRGTAEQRPAERRGGPLARPNGPFRGLRPPEWRRGAQPPAPPPQNVNPPAPPGPLTDDERKDVEKFLKDNSPKRYEKFQDLQDERQKRILEAARNQYRSLQQLKENDPEIYKLRIKRLPIEDEVFALGWDLRHGDTNTGDNQTRQKLRERVRALVDSRLDERKLRIQRLQDRLRQDQALLQQDLGNREALVERGMSAVEGERGGELRDLAAPVAPPTPRADSGDTDASKPPDTAPN